MLCSLRLPPSTRCLPARRRRGLQPHVEHLGRLAIMRCVAAAAAAVSFVPLLLLVAAYRPVAGCATAAAPQGTSRDTLILCRACGHELAAGTDMRLVPSRLALSTRNDTLLGGRRVNVQLFENPHGHRFEVITFGRADVTQHWPADRHFSWFPGYAWTVATCPRCRSHLGWAFQPNFWPDTVKKSAFDESELTFFALITTQLLREDFASSLLMTPRSFTS